MGFVDELKRLARPYEDEDEYEEEESNTEPIRSERSEKKASDADYAPVSLSQPSRSVGAADTRGRKVININTTTQLKVVLVRPEKYEDASEIADHLRDKRTVVLNLESTEKETSRRLLDFLSGVAYAQEGKIKKVAVSTYIITPYNVDLIGDRDLMDELESSGAYSFQ